MGIFIADNEIIKITNKVTKISHWKTKIKVGMLWLTKKKNTYSLWMKIIQEEFFCDIYYLTFNTVQKNISCALFPVYWLFHFIFVTKYIFVTKLISVFIIHNFKNSVCLVYNHVYLCSYSNKIKIQNNFSYIYAFVWCWWSGNQCNPFFLLQNVDYGKDSDNGRTEKNTNGFRCYYKM